MRARWKVLGGAGVFGAVLSLFIVMGHSRVSRGDTASTSSTTSSSTTSTPWGPQPEASPEPTTNGPVQAAPGSETPQKDPFAPYDLGAAVTAKTPKPYWAYSDLTPAEQAVVDRGRDTTGWDQVNNAYAQAVQDQAQHAAAASSAAQLGVDNLGSTGVVP